MRWTRARSRKALALVAITATAFALTGCSGGSGSGSSKTIHVTLITKDPNDPFWVAMFNGAKKEGKKDNVDVTIASGKDQTDSDGQIQAIENAVARGDDAIMIANNGPAVNAALKKAEDAGLLVVALDTPTTPADLVSATYATDNFEAGQSIGKWTAGTLGGKPATIALIDLFSDKVVSVDYQRDQGFLSGMGIPLNDKNKNGDEAKTGKYSGGTYTIACNQASDGAEDGGRTAMEKCLSINPNINVVYTANEPSALGAVQALKAAGITDALVTSINGSCDGIKSVKDGTLGADAQQYPATMAADGIKAAIEFVRNGTKPKVDANGFINTGSKLVTDKPVDGLDSITSTAGAASCY